MTRSIKTFALTFALTVAAAPLAAEQISGRLVDTGGAMPRNASMSFTLKIDEYSTDAEIAGLAEILANDGPAAMQREMRQQERGWIRIGTGLRHEVAVARSIASDGERILRVVLDRPISSREIWHGLQSPAYPFTVLEIRLDDSGRGQGTMIAAARLEMNDKGTLEVDSLGRQPFRILSAQSKAS